MTDRAVPGIALNDGNVIPQLGFGTYQVDPADAVETVSHALKAGYRHIDTAEMYGNEAEVGEAAEQSGIDRSQLYLTSKLNNGYHEPDKVRQAFGDTLDKLGVPSINLFLIHWPLPTKYDGNYVATWQTLEEFKKDGSASSIGVSNFQVEHLEKLAAAGCSVPAVNQIEVHPYFQNRTVVKYCQDKQIAVEAWSPLGQGGELLSDNVLQGIADETSKTTAQVVLRWHVQKGYIIFPKSSDPQRIAENFAIFDFELSDDQMAAIDGLNRGESGRMGPNPDTFDMIPPAN